MKKPISAPEGTPCEKAGAPSQSEDQRSEKDRRKITCEGHTYIPIVGWYCRRKQTRRGDDNKPLRSEQSGLSSDEEQNQDGEG